MRLSTEGCEPSTDRFQACCSTTELCPNPPRRASPWLRQFPARIPCAASASRSYPVLQRLLGPRDPRRFRGATPRPHRLPPALGRQASDYCDYPLVIDHKLASLPRDGSHVRRPGRDPRTWTTSPFGGCSPYSASRRNLTHPESSGVRGAIPDLKSPAFRRGQGDLSVPTPIPLARDPKNQPYGLSPHPAGTGWKTPFGGDPRLA